MGPKKKQFNPFNQSPFIQAKLKEPKIFNPHTLQQCVPSEFLFPNQYYLQLVTIDPGTVSCGIRIVKYYYLINKKETVWFGIMNFGHTIEEVVSGGLERQMNNILNNIIYSHYIVIESQPLIRGNYKNSTINQSVYRTAQHMISYLNMNVRDKGFRPIVIEVDLAFKTIWLGGPRTSKQNNGKPVKEWTQKRSPWYLQNINDVQSLLILNNSKEKMFEDLCDTVAYEEGFWTYMFTRNDISKNFFLNGIWQNNSTIYNSSFFNIFI